MADLSDVNSSGITRIVGSDSSGSETTPVKASANGDIMSANISDNGGVQGALTVGTSAVEAKVGASPLSNRKSLSVFNNSNAAMYWGYDNTVTTSNGTPIFKNQLISWDVGPNTSIYLIAGSAGNDSRITENA